MHKEKHDVFMWEEHLRVNDLYQRACYDIMPIEKTNMKFSSLLPHPFSESQFVISKQSCWRRECNSHYCLCEMKRKTDYFSK